MNNQPPKWILWFLEKTCASPFLDELEGDLLELFERDFGAYGEKKRNANLFGEPCFPFVGIAYLD